MELRGLTEAAGELEIVDSTTAPPIDIDQLVVQDAVDEVHAMRGHQWAPPSVMSINGIAASETTRMIAKYSQPTVLARWPLA
jgi:hypothetical protein